VIFRVTRVVFMPVIAAASMRVTGNVSIS